MRLSILLLIIIFSVTLLAGCGNDQYAIERQYWRAQKQAEKIFTNPDASPPKELERVINIFNKFSAKYARSNLAIDADFSIIQLYITKKEYDKARSQVRYVMRKYKDLTSVLAEALFLLGNTYEKQGDWPAALAQYKKVMREYPTTLRGLDMPIYIARYYKIKYEPNKMVEAFQEAITYYQGLANKYSSDLTFAFSTDTLAARCYLALNDWQNAIKSFDAILKKYQGKVSLDPILLEISLIYNKELKNKVKAREYLERLLKEYPKSRLITTAKELIKELDKK